MVCVLCALPLAPWNSLSAPSYSVAGGFPRRGLFKAAASGSSMTLSGPHCVHMVWTMVTEIVPTGSMLSKTGHLLP